MERKDTEDISRRYDILNISYKFIVPTWLVELDIFKHSRPVFLRHFQDFSRAGKKKQKQLTLPP